MNFKVADSIVGIKLPELDEDLIRVASASATDSNNIHDVNNDIGIYRGSVTGAHRLMAIIQELGPQEGDVEDLNRRIGIAEKYRALLQSRVVESRLSKLAMPA